MPNVKSSVVVQKRRFLLYCKSLEIDQGVAVVADEVAANLLKEPPKRLRAVFHASRDRSTCAKRSSKKRVTSTVLDLSGSTALIIQLRRGQAQPSIQEVALRPLLYSLLHMANMPESASLMLRSVEQSRLSRGLHQRACR